MFLFANAREMLKWAVKKQSNQTIVSIILCGMWELWGNRNKLIFEGTVIQKEAYIRNVILWVKRLGFLFNGNLENNIQELDMLGFFSISPRFFYKSYGINHHLGGIK